MASSEENNFEDSWRKAFEEAQELPPASVWDKIEARLDEDDDRVVVLPLWRRWQTLASIAAASVLVLFVLMSDDWFSKTTPVITKQEKVKVPSSQHVAPNKPEVQQEASLASSAQEKEEEAIISSLPKNPSSLSGNQLRKKKSVLAEIAKETSSATAYEKKEVITEPIIDQIVTLPSQSYEKIVSTTNQATAPSSQAIISLSTPFITLSSLEIRKMNELLGPSKRQPWVVYQAASDEQKVPSIASKQYWLSMGIMPASYNAGVAIGEVSRSGGTFGIAKQAALYNTVPTDASANRAAISYALQWHGGVQLAQRWSLETGVNYLQGNSIFEATNGFNVFTNSYINNLEAAVIASDNNKPTYSLSSISADKALIQPLATTQNINNSYQFVQVPLQAGYALMKPKKKFSLWLLGGVINNVFLKNSFKSGQERTVIVNGPDSPYKRFSFTASTGMRLQYKINKRWSSQLTGNYQLALGTSTKQAAVFEARPHLLGLGAGLRYGF